jgi:SAM-dependent methyltransferase
MLGSREPLASLAFSALAKEVYGAEQSYIIDIVSGNDKQRHGNFMYGDALRMPFADNSLDVIHASQLFFSIEDSQGQFSQSEEMMRQVFKEASRALKPGGQLLMRELLWGSNDAREIGSTQDQISELMTVMKGMCRSAGFGHAQVRPLAVPSSLRGLTDPHRNFWADGFELRPDCYTIYASNAM